jgi:hypothetical protein
MERPNPPEAREPRKEAIVTATRDRWIVCQEYAAGPFTEAAAGGMLAQIQAGQAQGDPRTCRYPHDIVISRSKPETAADRARGLSEREPPEDAGGAHTPEGESR